MGSGDFAAILALNHADVHHLAPLSAGELESLVSVSSYARVAQVGNVVAGFIAGVPSTADHASHNFRWFKQRYARFMYVDRVVVASAARRMKLASHFYADLERHARTHAATHVVCEINLRPPNPGSFAFHDRQGFVEVGTRNVDDTKIVSMRIKPCGSAPPPPR